MAGASKVIVLGRRPDVLQESVSRLSRANHETAVAGRASDISVRAEARQLWDDLEKERTTVDILVLNAVGFPEAKTILEQGADRLWEDFENNVHAPLYHVERFYKQPQHTGQKVPKSLATT